MQTNNPYHRNNYLLRNQGFTLVELVTVIVIVGIMATVGAAKFFNQSSFQDTQYHQEIISAFRYAQKIAIASQCNVDIVLTSNSYTLDYAASSSCADQVLKNPASQAAYSDTGTVDIAPTPNFTYDAQGIASSTGAFTFTVGESARVVTIEPVTGYVHD
jgi:MSHA pilin protein MshC